MNPAQTSALVVAARALLLSAALGLAGTGLALVVRGEARAPPVAHYACPMHPEVSAAEPGHCAICKMELEPRSSALAPGAVAVAQLSEHAYACPMHPQIVGDAPGRCSICMTAFEHTGAPKRSLSPPSGDATPSSRFAPGVTWLPETAPPALPTRPGDPAALGAAKRRVFVDRVIGPAWLEAADRVVAVLYRDDLVGLSPGERSAFVPAGVRRAAVSVQLTADRPTGWDGSTALVRFSIESRGRAPGSAPLEPAPELVPGQTGWLELANRPRELLVIPESALLRSAEGPYVLVPRAGRSIERRFLEIGRTHKGQVSVLAGLQEGERLVIGGAFFLDVERSLPSSQIVAGKGP